MDEIECVTCGEPADYKCGGCGLEYCNSCIDKSGGICDQFCEKDMGWQGLDEEEEEG